MWPCRAQRLSWRMAEAEPLLPTVLEGDRCEVKLFVLRVRSDDSLIAKWLHRCLWQCCHDALFGCSLYPPAFKQGILPCVHTSCSTQDMIDKLPMRAFVGGGLSRKLLPLIGGPARYVQTGHSPCLLLSEGLGSRYDKVENPPDDKYQHITP